MTLILSNETLRNLLCSVCGKYLSALPVKVYGRGVVKCGRCCSENDGGTQSLYQTVIAHCLFKCVNRYEGCNMLLTPSDVLSHEKNCTGGVYVCPKCEGSYSGTAYELLQHYNYNHPASILKKNKFFVSAEEALKERYLYVIKNKVFFVLVENILCEKLYVSVVSIKTCGSITQEIYVKVTGKTTTSYTSEVKPCVSLNNFRCDYFKIYLKMSDAKQVKCHFNLDLSQDVSVVDQISSFSGELTNDLFPKGAMAKLEYTPNIPVEDVLGVQLTDEFQIKYPDYKLTPCGTALFNSDGSRIELTCSNCRHFTGCFVFSCKLNKHIVCAECNTWCGICDGPVEQELNYEICCVNRLLLFPCKMCYSKGATVIPGDTLTKHGYNCFVKKCPVMNCQYSNVFSQFREHLLNLHNRFVCDRHFILNFNYLKRMSHLVSKRVYFLLNDYCFQMEWNKITAFGDVYEITVVPCEEVIGYELGVIFGNKVYNKLTDYKIPGKIIVNKKKSPEFYLKRVTA